MAEKRALITGITGQDGSYLAELLLEKGYKVFGVIRRNSTVSTERIEHLLDDIELIDADLLDSFSLFRAVKKSNPDEVYNLAAMSFVHTSFNQPVLSAETCGVGVVRLIEAIREFNPKIKFYQASTSEMFGKIKENPQTEETPFSPRSPYGYAKVMAHWATVNAREGYDMFACSGILFNHESPRRGIEFVTRKITYNIAKIKHGLADCITLGNLDAKRDWGFAGDFVEAMWLMLQQDTPEDYVIATGETRTVREFLDAAFKAADLPDYEKYVKIDKKFFRPAEVDILIGDMSKAEKQLGWKPKTSFNDLVELMVTSDLELVKSHYKL